MFSMLSLMVRITNFTKFWNITEHQLLRSVDENGVSISSSVLMIRVPSISQKAWLDYIGYED